jgi:hypothetical protein
MLKKILVSCASLCATLNGLCQTTEPAKSTTTVSGYIDGYYRSLIKDGGGVHNNYTSFTNSYNSFNLGMASIKIDQTFGKFSSTLDIGVGKRVEEFSYNDKDLLTNIKQVTLSFAATKYLKLTAGKFSTHIGYELLDATSNRNYSMSYGFSYGPFFHTGLKADIALGGKSALMVGIVDPTDYSTVNSTPKYIIAQFSTGSNNDKIKAYVNFLHGDITTQYNVVMTAALSKKMSLAFDGSINHQKNPVGNSSWNSEAVYLNYDFSDKFGITLREDFFNDRAINPIGIGNINATTISGKIKFNKLTIIPEIRMDNSTAPLFNTKTGTSQTASNLLIAAVYTF